MIKGKDIKYLNEGFCSTCYLIDNKYIFLRGKNNKSYTVYKNEYKMLKRIKDEIKSTKIPTNIMVLEKNDENIYGGIIYDCIEGEKLDYNLLKEYNLKNIAKGISNFLNELHSIKINYNYEEIIKEEINNLKDNIKNIKKLLTENDNKKIIKFEQDYLSFLNKNKELSITHGDLWYENYIISEDKESLNGIIDFENCKYFYKEEDLTPLLYIGEDFLDEVLANYNYKIEKRNIKLFQIRREIISFNYISEFFKEEIDEQLEKIQNALTLLY